MTFPIDEVYLDARVLSGSTWGLEDDVVDKPSGAGVSEVNPLIPRPRRSWLFSWPRKQAVDAVESMFEKRGNRRGFLLVPRRHRDYIFTDQVIGTGDGSTTTFRFKVTKDDGAGPPLIIPVLRVLGPGHGPSDNPAPAPTFKLDDVLVDPGDYTVNYTKPATVIFDTAPALGVIIKAALFWRAWASKFLSNKIDTTVYHENHQEMRSVSIGEVFEDET